MLTASARDVRIDEGRTARFSVAAILSGEPFMPLSGQAISVLRAMSGRLYGRLERDAPFLLDAGWSGPVPGEVAEELHDAGLIEIDETAPIIDAYTFRISEAGMDYLNAMAPAKRKVAD
jgi:hypothetical protein